MAFLSLGCSYKNVFGQNSIDFIINNMRILTYFVHTIKGIQEYRNINTKNYKYTDIKYTNLQTYKYTDIKHTEKQTYRLSNIQTYTNN